eukprot:4006040-Prymnesium_polylepis.1
MRAQNSSALRRRARPGATDSAGAGVGGGGGASVRRALGRYPTRITIITDRKKQRGGARRSPMRRAHERNRKST